MSDPRNPAQEQTISVSPGKSPNAASFGDNSPAPPRSAAGGGTLTQAVPRDGDPPSEERVPLQEQLVQAVHLGRHRVHDGLAIGGAVVEENVQDGVVDEVTQAVDAGQGDPLQVPAGDERTEGTVVNPTAFLQQNARSEEDCQRHRGQNAVTQSPGSR